MKRILILGSGGSGKSTLSIQLQQITGLPVIHLDAFYWNPNWVETPPDEWAIKVSELMKQDTWIMDGNYGGTMEMRLKRADYVIFLKMPRLLCIFRVIYRRFRHIGKERVSMAKGCKDRLTWEFIRYLWSYPNKSGVKALQKIKKYEGKVPIHILNSKKEVAQFIQTIKHEYAN